MKIFILLISIVFLAEKDSLSLKHLEKMIKNKNKVSIDTSNINLDLNKGVMKSIKFIPKDPYKNRLSDFMISADQINEIKNTARDYKPSPLSKDDLVIIETTKGIIKIKLFIDLAPNHCLNFKKLCNSGFYDGTSFHRVIKDFMIQGGDILSRDNDRNNDGTGSPGWVVDAEFSDAPHKRGILSMARSPRGINTAGSQFFICVNDSPWLDEQYTVFGEVVEGMDVVDKIVESTTDRDMILLSTVKAIPQGEILENWIEIIDPKTKRKLYSKIPLGDNKTGYSDRVRKDLRSDNPYRRVEIIKARVYINESNE